MSETTKDKILRNAHQPVAQIARAASTTEDYVRQVLADAGLNAAQEARSGPIAPLNPATVAPTALLDLDDDEDQDDEDDTVVDKTEIFAAARAKIDAEYTAWVTAWESAGPEVIGSQAHTDRLLDRKLREAGISAGYAHAVEDDDNEFGLTLNLTFTAPTADQVAALAADLPPGCPLPPVPPEDGRDYTVYVLDEPLLDGDEVLSPYTVHTTYPCGIDTFDDDGPYAQAVEDYVWELADYLSSARQINAECFDPDEAA